MRACGGGVRIGLRSRTLTPRAVRHLRRSTHGSCDHACTIRPTRQATGHPSLAGECTPGPQCRNLSTMRDSVPQAADPGLH